MLVSSDPSSQTMGFGIDCVTSLHGLPFKVFKSALEALRAGPPVDGSFPARHRPVLDDG
jgi:multiple sugar transport system ATP-binding protein